MSVNETSPADDEAGDVVDLGAERAARQGPVPVPASRDLVPVNDTDRPGTDLEPYVGPDIDEDAPIPVDVVVTGVHEHGRDLAPAWSVDRRSVDRPVIPVWLRDPATARQAAAWGVRYAGQTTAFHTLRVPVYWARLAARSPVGVFRMVRSVWRWVFDADGADVRRALSANARGSGYGTQDATAYARLEEQRRELVRGRSLMAAVVVLLLACAGWGVSATCPPWLSALLAAALVAFLGLAGRDMSRPVVSRYTDQAAVPRFTSDLILTALGALSISELNKGIKAGDGVRFPSPIVRDGAGWRAEIDLPAGVTAGAVIERRDRLAAGLRRPMSAVWPEADSDEHEARLVLWVADKAMSKTKPVPWPLAAKGTTSVFEEFPIGVDPRGRPVTITLISASMVIGAQPRMGKTFTARVIMLGAALDPTVELHIYDLKGGADWNPLAQVAHAFRRGDEPEDIAYLLGDLRDLATDMRRRYKTIRGLDLDVCPEGKITPDLAKSKALGLHPVVVYLDECQIAFEHPDHGKELTALAEDLTKRGPAAGIICINATQRPDAKSLPPGISTSAGLRLCLKVANQTVNDMVLGTGAHKSGIAATMFTLKELGVGYLSGETADPVILRAAYIDAKAAYKIAARARAARLAAGRLTGYAAGTDPTPDTSTASILDHLVAVWPATEDWAWCKTLAERLAAAFPATYTGWTAENVTAAVRPHGMRNSQINRRGSNQRGFYRTSLTDALTDRADQQPGDTDDVDDGELVDEPVHLVDTEPTDDVGERAGDVGQAVGEAPGGPVGEVAAPEGGSSPATYRDPPSPGVMSG
jgi:S-DNA-T family DNA segregation ATPase FtsK/SpoIIIE